MQDTQKQAADLLASTKQAIIRAKIPDHEASQVTLQKQAASETFWNDSQSAQTVMQQIAKLERRIKPWRQLEADLQETLELAATGDETLAPDVIKQFNDTKQRFDKLQFQLQFSGPYDDSDALLSIHAGAGGTDAQDWAGMLLRMYVRYAEAQDWAVTMIDESAGEEAGIKSVTFEISGDFIYGNLKAEHGVHRLVRLSPFNSDSLRQTSFAKVEIMPKIDRPDAIVIDDKDLKIDVYRSGGKGGQSVNTTDSAVRITHMPTNLVVAIQNERSQLQNRETAMTILRSRLAQLQSEQHLEDLQNIKGPNQSAEWGNQIRSYVLHPYKQVKDLRTRHETSDAEGVLDGDLGEFIKAGLSLN